MASFQVAAQSQDLASIRTLASQGQVAQAMSQLDSYLAQQPDDPQARFLKGIMLVEQNNTNEAIDIFSKLTTDFPDLPEPHNNLAVLYAAGGEYTKARDALLVAINTHPTYATAHENLGDIYAKMAGIAYDNALQLDRSNDAAKSKLALVRDLFSVRADGSGQATESMMTAAAPASPAVPAAPEPPATVQEPEPPTTTAMVTPEPAATVTPEVPIAKTFPIETAPAQPAPTVQTGGGSQDDDVLATVFGWASAWSSQDTDSYLSFYSSSFKPGRGMTRDQWEQNRRERLTKPGSIRVDLSDLQVDRRAEGRARVTFVQQYRSDNYQDQVRKSLRLVNDNGQWRITRESTLQ